jgi:phosphoglucosamine mutase
MQAPFAEETPLTDIRPERLEYHAVTQRSYAVGMRLVQQEPHRLFRPTVVIGAITLNSKASVNAALQDGFASAGVDTVLCGQLPIPAIAYLTRANKYHACAVVNDAWNPDWNGYVGFFSPEGIYLRTGAAPLSSLMEPYNAPSERHRQIDPSSQLSRPGESYIEFCKSGAMQQLNLSGLKIVIDSAHGSARKVAPKVFHELGAQVIALGLTTHGLNEADCAGSTVSQQLGWTVRALRADVGIGINREGNVLMMADSTGIVHCGHRLRSLTATGNTLGAMDDAIIRALRVLALMQASKLNLVKLIRRQAGLVAGHAAEIAACFELDCLKNASASNCLPKTAYERAH